MQICIHDMREQAILLHRPLNMQIVNWTKRHGRSWCVCVFDYGRVTSAGIGVRCQPNKSLLKAIQILERASRSGHTRPFQPKMRAALTVQRIEYRMPLAHCVIEYRMEWLWVQTNTKAWSKRLLKLIENTIEIHIVLRIFDTRRHNSRKYHSKQFNWNAKKQKKANTQKSESNLTKTIQETPRGILF